MLVGTGSGQLVRYCMGYCLLAGAVGAGEVALVGYLSPCETLDAEVIGSFGALARVDDIGFGSVAACAAAVALLEAGSVEGTAAGRIGAVTLAEQLVAGPNDQFLYRFKS